MEIKTSKIYPYPPSKIWHALTDSGALAEWLMPNDFRLEKDHEFTFETTPRGGFDGVVRCKILDFIPEQSLTYSWLGGKMKTPTEVRWVLEAHPEGTRLLLRHSGFEGFNGWVLKTILGMGWKINLLRKNLNTYLQS